MSVIDDIEIELKVELGATNMPVHHVLRLGRGAVIELDAVEDDPMKIYANNALIALGEVKIEDGRLAVTVSEKVVKAI